MTPFVSSSPPDAGDEGVKGKNDARAELGVAVAVV